MTKRTSSERHEGQVNRLVEIAHNLQATRLSSNYEGWTDFLAEHEESANQLFGSWAGLTDVNIELISSTLQRLVPKLSTRSGTLAAGRLLAELNKLLPEQTEIMSEPAPIYSEVSSERIKAICEQVVADLVNAIAKHTALIPLYGIRIECDPIDLTLASLVPASEYEIEGQLQPDSWVRVEIEADPYFAIDEAERRARLLADILTFEFSVPTLWRSKVRPVDIDMPSSGVTRVSVAVRVGTDAASATPTYIPNRSFDAPPNAITSEKVPILEKLGLFDLATKLLELPDDSKRSVWGRIRDAISWVASGIRSRDRRQAYISVTTALEALLSNDQSGKDPRTSWGGTGQHLADQSAYLVGNTYGERSDIVKRVKDLYGKRSILLHRAGEIDEVDLQELTALVRRVIEARVLFALKLGIDTDDKFLEWNNQCKYSTRADSHDTAPPAEPSSED